MIEPVNKYKMANPLYRAVLMRSFHYKYVFNDLYRVLAIGNGVERIVEEQLNKQSFLSRAYWLFRDNK